MTREQVYILLFLFTLIAALLLIHGLQRLTKARRGISKSDF